MSTDPARNVFVNIAFDSDHEKLLTAIVATVVGLGLNPRTVLEVPATTSRLQRLHSLLTNCAYSIHDLSCVKLSPGAYRVPRFNMPFELGLAFAMSLTPHRGHQVLILEAVRFRLQPSLSDTNGIDPSIHRGTVSGMIDAVRDAFCGVRRPPISTSAQFWAVYRGLQRYQSQSSADLFSPSGYKQIVVAARRQVDLAAS